MVLICVILSLDSANPGQVVRRKVRKQAFYSDEESEEVEEDVFIQATGDDIRDVSERAIKIDYFVYEWLNALQ